MTRQNMTSAGGLSSTMMTVAALVVALAVSRVTGEHQATTTISQRNEEQLDAGQNQRNSYLHEPPDLDKYQELDESRHFLREPESRDYLDRLVSEELDKRAPMGFQGMRGKKYWYDEDYYSDKRAPMGFQGMRGKKSYYDEDYYDDPEKRAPMGFQGMRGKKSLEEVLDELEKRKMMGFQGMRGKKAEDYEVAEWQKRVPNGFIGMRGRKNSGLVDELDDFEKRALLGFHGMRGKKNIGTYDQDLDLDMMKRPKMMGFHGMRGKRSINYYDEDDRGYEKRSYRLVGSPSRGKKNPRWALRGKFVGVRGKKSWPSQRLVQSLQQPSIFDERTFFSLNTDALH